MSLVDEVKSRLDIVDVVSRHVPLQKAGRGFKALCPFHAEKTPSFFVFPERQTWRCFGACATGGDLFTFVMRAENLAFPEALRRLAQQAGVTIPARDRRQEGDALYQINEAARELFGRLLASSEGAGTRAYLERRGLSPESVEAFQMGFSPRDGITLTGYLTSRGYAEEQLALAGLVTQGEGGRYRDLFRGRLMFPIRDAQGRLAGFGGRALDDSTPKYLNSPRTPVFDKGRILYGLDRALARVQGGEVVVVEGYMDVIMAHQCGFSNVVASMGTALTEHQAALLRGLAGTVILALDPDVAGQEAALRSLESSWQVFQQRAVARIRGTTLYERPEVPDIRVAPLPQGRDPDEIILEDPGEWERLVAGAAPLMEYLFTSLASRFDLKTPQGKAQVAGLLFPLVTAMTDPFAQDRSFQRLAQLLGVSESTLVASLGRPRPARPSPPPREATPTPFARLEHDPLEEYCLALLLQHPELAPQAQGLSLEHFRRVENREVFTHWMKGVNINNLREELDQELAEHLEHLLGRELPPSDVKERELAFRDCLRRLEERRLREMKVEEELRLAQATREELYQEQDRVLELNEQIRRLFLPRVE